MAELWKIPVLTFMQSISGIHLLTPCEEQRMYRETTLIMVREYMEQPCFWFSKNNGAFRTQEKGRPFLLIDPGLDKP